MKLVRRKIQFETFSCILETILDAEYKTETFSWRRIDWRIGTGPGQSSGTSFMLEIIKIRATWYNDHQ